MDEFANDNQVIRPPADPSYEAERDLKGEVLREGSWSPSAQCLVHPPDFLLQFLFCLIFLD